MNTHLRIERWMRQPSTRNIPIFLALSIVLVAWVTVGSMSRAAQAPINLGTADSFAVLAGSAVTNTGPTVVSGDLGVSPGSAVTGFPVPGTVNNGTIHANDAVAAQAQLDLTTAYNVAAGRPCDSDLTGQDLGGLTLVAGAYCFSSSAQLTGPVTLNAQGVPSAVFIFQIVSTLTTASVSSVNLINGADACNVFWQVGSSATLGSGTAFKGNILALTSITLNTGATIESGRALARNGAVTLDTNTVSREPCSSASSPTPTPTAEPAASPTASPTEAPTAEPAASPTASPTEAPTAEPAASPTASPTEAPTPTPLIVIPGLTPTPSPTSAPTDSPTSGPTTAPVPAPAETAVASSAPTRAPAATPTASVLGAAAGANPSVSAEATNGGEGTLPSTGASIAVLVLLGLALIAGGVFLHRLARGAGDQVV